MTEYIYSFYGLLTSCKESERFSAALLRKNRDIHTYIQTDRQTDKQSTDRQKDRHRQTVTANQTQTDRNRQTARHTDILTGRQT